MLEQSSTWVFGTMLVYTLAIFVHEPDQLDFEEACQPHRVSTDQRRTARLRKAADERLSGTHSPVCEVVRAPLANPSTILLSQDAPASPAPEDMEPGPRPAPAGDAVSWLLGQQNPARSGGKAYESIDRATVAEPLRMVESRPPKVADDASWLAGQSAGNYEELARQMVVLGGNPGYESYAATLADTLWAARDAAETDNMLPSWVEAEWGPASTEVISAAIS